MPRQPERGEAWQLMRKVLLLALIAAAPLRAADPVEQSCREFLTHLPSIEFATTGTSVSFAGEFMPIPAELTTELQRLFPDYSFRIANMTYIHWGPEPVHPLLVVERLHDKVCSYMWDVWFTDPPMSFRTLFHQQGQPVETAKARITALARLVAFQTGWSVAEVTVEDGVVFAPLINTENEVWRIVRSRVSPGFPFEWLAIVHPKDKLKAPPQ